LKLFLFFNFGRFVRNLSLSRTQQFQDFQLILSKI
jgi:hypothetical protein